MAGRKRIFELSPLSFTEFAEHQTGYPYPVKPADSSDIVNPELMSLFHE